MEDIGTIALMEGGRILGEGAGNRDAPWTMDSRRSTELGTDSRGGGKRGGGGRDEGGEGGIRGGKGGRG